MNQLFSTTITTVLISCFILIAGCSEQPKPETNTKTEVAKKPEEARKPVIDADGYTVLMLDNFNVFQGKQKKGTPEIKTPTWSSNNGEIHCTGQPRGYIYTKKKYKNFIFEIDIRYPKTDGTPEELENSNTGILLYITGEHRLWPICLEVQGKHRLMGNINANGKRDVIDADKVKDNQKAREASRKKVGEWNRLRVVSKDGILTSYLNDTKICENEAGELSEGFIGLQSERNPIEFKNIRVLEN